LVLVPSDSDEEIFAAVRVGPTRREARVLGWLRGSEGKLPQYYQKNCWVIPPEALHDMEKLPGKERLRGDATITKNSQVAIVAHPKDNED
jgi:hypothetical protein